MSIILSVGATSVTLPPDLYWSDEVNYTPVKQSVEPSITGASIVQAAAMVDGQSITLQSVDEQSAWIGRADLLTVLGWAKIPGQEMTLNIQSTNHTVVFRHHEPPALEAKPVVHYSDIGSTDFYHVTLKFMKV